MMSPGPKDATVGNLALTSTSCEILNPTPLTPSVLLVTILLGMTPRHSQIRALPATSIQPFQGSLPWIAVSGTTTTIRWARSLVLLHKYTPTTILRRTVELSQTEPRYRVGSPM